MTENKNPATPPANGATPGSNEQGNGATAPNTPPATNNGTQGNSPAGVVTLSTEQYRQLERDAARGRSKERRDGLPNRQPANNANNDNQDPEKVELMTRASAAERRAMQLEVKEKVREVLDKPEYKDMPKSTRDLILKNPASLSSAETLEEAMVDIENFLDEQAAELKTAGSGQGNNQADKNKNPVQQTPPVVNSGSPAPVNAVGLEDVSKLSGPARSQAAIRNAIKAKKGIV